MRKIKENTINNIKMFFGIMAIVFMLGFSFIYMPYRLAKDIGRNCPNGIAFCLGEVIGDIKKGASK